VIEDVVNIHGKAFRFFDTAGLRETSDTIETMGIARSYSKLDQATIVILVVDSCSDFNTISTSVEKIKERLNQQHLIVVANKIDRAKHENFAQLAKLKLRENDQLILIAAKQKTNIEQLIEVMQKTVSPEALQDDAVVVTNVRHFEALSNAHDSIERVQTGLENRISGDFLAQDIRECLHYLGEITGEISTDEILGHIFKNFCIGK
jgi:tRNA modification GTPase